MDAMDAIREGMTVVGPDGDELGSVKSFKAGDPQAVTAQGQESVEGNGLVGSFFDAFDGGGIDEGRRERLLRLGYVEVDGRGLRGDFVVEADRIDRIENDTVHLSAVQ